MRYSLWSHDCLVAHTELDIPCVQDHLRQGFLEPTKQGARALIDATGVTRVCATRPARARRSANEEAYFAEFTRACERREALNFVLRDESGEAFECDFIRIWDLKDDPYESVFDEAEELDCGDFEAELEADADLDSDLLAEMEEVLSLHEESERYGSHWPPRDDRWDTMPYLIQVFLHRESYDMGNGLSF